MSRIIGIAGIGFAFLLSACLPNPQSVAERRESFSRSGLKGSLILSSLPADAKAVGAVFGNRIKLEGYRLNPRTPKRGDRVSVTLFWGALKPVNEDYQVFVHGDAKGGNARRLHGDHFPAKGKYPTDVWRPGEIIVDEFSMKVSKDYGAPKLGIYTGLYKGNYRLPLTSKGNAPSDTANRSQPVEITF